MKQKGIQRRLAPSFLPPVAVLEMTYRCNHFCIFCSCPWYADGNGFEIQKESNVDEWKALIRKICEMGVCKIAFTGGEPLLKKGILEIIEFAASCTVEHIETKNGNLLTRRGPPNLYLLSNGKIITTEILELCRTYRINLSMSLPGLNTFVEHTQSDINAGHVLKWFQRAHNFGVSTTVGITVTRKNLHELYETISEALIAGADNLMMNRFLPGGRGIKNARDLSLDTAEITQMLDIAEEVLRTAHRNGSIGTELPKCLVDKNKYKNLKVGTRCSAALDFFVIDPSGYIRVCNHSPVRLNHVSEIEKVKEHPYWRSFVMKDYLPDFCIGCQFMTNCDGGCREAAHITGGSLDSVDPAFDFSISENSCILCPIPNQRFFQNLRT